MYININFSDRCTVTPIYIVVDSLNAKVSGEFWEQQFPKVSLKGVLFAFSVHGERKARFV